MSESRLVQLVKQDNIVLLSVNNPPVNTINAAVRRDLNAALDELATLQGVQAVVLACEGSTFFSGADIGEFSGPPQEEAYRTLFGRLEQLEVPVVAAMHGTVMGGGLEIALACHYRVAAPRTRFGLPEVTLGIIPGAGGTQRMPRLIGVEKTLQMILDAKPVDTAVAVEWGFLDAVLEGDLRQAALAYAGQLAAGGKGARRTSERNTDLATCSDAIIEQMKAKAAKQYPNRHAPFTAIKAVQASLTLPFARGLELETELVNQAKVSDEAKGAVHAFFADRETRRVPDLPAEAKARKVGMGGIIGAGTMGGGIAICFANAGLPVVMIDSSREALDRGLAGVDRTYESMVKRGRITAEDKARRMALITGSLDYAELKDADVVIEAVFEDMALKKDIFARLDKVAKPGAVLASNTSTLDIDEIARATSRPGDVIGMHFFSPANVMPLLEVVRTASTSAETIRTVMDLAKPLRKTPVLARVCYGFIGNRMMEGYAREAERMVLEGANPRAVDSALEQWGMAMGILAVFDMAGVDIGVNVHKANAERFPPDPAYYQADFALVEAGRLGQKNGKGYYRYEAGDRKRYDDPEAIAILKARAEKLGVPPREHTAQEIVERCLYPLLNEGIRILEEGVAIRAGDIDVVWTAGYGFPRYRGGPMFYADTIGLKTLLAGMLKYREIFGPMHWEPAKLLVDLVEKGQSLADWQRTQKR
ncbi:MAG: enoyl-CoA hydratase/isomerase family protein [Betaproteobacteria bacterium]|nr:enoyl-CoA hydratase/isomerase family protein [Betaproteobacteria bacterium]